MEFIEYPEINSFLNTALDEMKVILGDNLVGLYLYGSLVWGDFDENISDVDLLAVTKTPLNGSEFAQLEKLHNELVKSYKELDNRVEIAYAHLAALKTFKIQKSEISVISPGEPFHKKEAGIDWLINWYIVLQQGKTLFGPDSDRVIEPISKEEFVQAVQRQAKEWADWVIHTKGSRPYQGHAILTMCRAFYAQKHGEQVSKKQAALWAMIELPEWTALIQQALQWRRDFRNREVDNEATYPQTEKFVKYMAGRIAGF
ncbi:MAG: hypothetical protein UU77_C0030G0007 [candidate division WWE3 bacterium GW2011_GWC1_41_7]|uniref:Adenylyltransferase AadA C-terminal domain-containing protein n=3 Tax=Katanobacteria TaxID=422282 RepID=A0A0G0X8Q4_UNCKA|nr:MAG: hypothetical protein UU72_C0041G0002 [candidate division WWE3 bacterium GW2011_GWB1_41_6]KKS20229.1 MAG: hypothetical protein UU77_C0030G0007 [candidate division WWE3 bacterium GW2011_GWC1_41_7]KKS21300.1 MAG: hypothetical protein UU80_C0031G0002 [candidate division WWE3 bacterium GW2011_GWA1_41_8]